jgi:phosphatidylserine/phosphatidylglycerophosphate/cardiolipin synthase-like enzyme
MFLRILLALGFATLAYGQDHGPYHPESAYVWFSPNGGAADACVSVLNGAKRTVYVQAYSFTSAAIAKALVDARKRGLVVEVILDKSQRGERYTEADFISHAGIPTYIDARHAIAHNKIMIVDGETVITGSFNFTKSAEENNAENLLVLRDPALAARYYRNWLEHKVHSDVFTPRSEAAMLPAGKPAAHAKAQIARVARTRSPISLGVSGKWRAYEGYTANFKATVEGHWREEATAAGLEEPAGGRLTVRILLAADGNVARIMSLQGEVSEEAKSVCQRALTAGNSYGRWTEPMIRDLGTSQEVTVGFTF